MDLMDKKLLYFITFDGIEIYECSFFNLEYHYNMRQGFCDPIEYMEVMWM